MTLARWIRAIALAALVLLVTGVGVVGCSDDTSTPTPDTVKPEGGIDGGSDGAADGGGKCQSFATEHEKLLNAPTNATVIRKTPTHPPLGDGGLP